MGIINGTSENFDELTREGKVLVDFNADWCGPCKMLHPVLEEIASERNDAKIVSINVDDEEDLAAKFGVMSIPCLVLFENGKEVARTIGFKPKEEVLNLLGDI